MSEEDGKLGLHFSSLLPMKLVCMHRAWSVHQEVGKAEQETKFILKKLVVVEKWKFCLENLKHFEIFLTLEKIVPMTIDFKYSKIKPCEIKYSINS